MNAFKVRGQGKSVQYVPSHIRNTIIPQWQMYRVKVNRGVLGVKEM